MSNEKPEHGNEICLIYYGNYLPEREPQYLLSINSDFSAGPAYELTLFNILNKYSKKI